MGYLMIIMVWNKQNEKPMILNSEYNKHDIFIWKQTMK